MCCQRAPSAQRRAASAQRKVHFGGAKQSPVLIDNQELVLQFPGKNRDFSACERQTVSRYANAASGWLAIGKGDRAVF